MSRRVALCVLAILTSSCVNDGVVTGNGFVGIGASIQAATAQDRLQVTRFEILVDEIVFDAEGPGGSISITQGEVSLVDVLTGTEVPELISIVLRTGTHTSVNLGVELRDDGPGLAILLEGTLEDVPIRLEFDSAEVLERSTPTLEVRDGQEVLVLFIFDPEAWFEVVDPGSLVIGNGGIAVISSTSNAADFDTVADRIDASTQAVFP